VEGARGSLRFSAETCTYCSLCALKCPTGAISVDRVKKAWVLDRFKCIVCAACVDACQKSALFTDANFAPPAQEHVVELYRVDESTDSCPHPEGEGA
jgi:ech hydrogenase subunit F